MTAANECDNAGSSACQSCPETGCPSAGDPQTITAEEKVARDQALQQRMDDIRHKLLVLSGKGGVGKSTVAVNLAVALARAGKKVGLLDVDFHGPSIPTMLGLQGETVESDGHEIFPVVRGGLRVMSMGLLVPNADDAVIWRGPMKMGVIEQLLRDVQWGAIDYLVIDLPPGTGDEPLSLCQLIDKIDGAVTVTTPQEVAAADVRRSISFCRKLDIPLLGVVENMSGFACPHCGEVTDIFRRGGGQQLAAATDVPLLGQVPLDPAVAESGDAGTPYAGEDRDTPAAAAFQGIIQPILALDED